MCSTKIPKDPTRAVQMSRSAVPLAARAIDGPVAVRYPQLCVLDVDVVVASWT